MVSSCCVGRLGGVSVRTNPKLTLEEEFSDVYDRIKKLEQTISKRILPVGYRWSVGANNELIVTRETDSTSVTVIT